MVLGVPILKHFRVKVVSFVKMAEKNGNLTICLNGC